MTSILEKDFSVNYLNPKNVKIFRNDNGMLCMEYEGTVYWKLGARRALPHQSREEFIFIYNFNDDEVGAVRVLKDLPKETRHHVKDLLRKRYFTREIREIYSIIDKFSVLIFKVRTEIKELVEFTVVRPKDSIYRSRQGGFLITDVDKNMYHVPSRDVLDYKDLIRIERYC